MTEQNNFHESDPIAIVGMGCRVPGATSPSELWTLMETQRDVRRKMPSERFHVDAFYHPNGKNKGTTNTKSGYFLDQDISEFDSGFFNVSGKEAEAMDPQQRMALEVVYEALENARIPYSTISGSNTSVFCGSFTNDYAKMTDRDMQSYPTHTVTGTGQSIISNRISYFYNLHGESMTIDTACSSSLIGLHLGAQSLKTGDSDMAIIIGTSLHFDPNMFTVMADFGMLSPEGRSRSFDADANGYARGEGVCAVVLKPLSAAKRDGDRVQAIIRATKANHDGLKNGITLPNDVAQEALIRKTYESANLPTKETAFFEAHGTGTAAGDPREARAIGSVFGGDGRLSPLYVGSVKSCIGHLEGAAGLAAIIKATLSIQRGKIIPNMHFTNPNPEIDFASWMLQVPRKMIDWPSDYAVRRASINSFGYGGSNCHVILEGCEAAATSHRVNASERASEKGPYLIPISTHSQKAGEKALDRLGVYLQQHPTTDISDLAHTLVWRREIHSMRTYVVAENMEELSLKLRTRDDIREWQTAGTVARIGFVFTGQGAQWAGMGAGLLHSCSTFRDTLEKCQEALNRLPDPPEWSIIEELLKEPSQSRLSEAEFSQPLVTIVQLGLVRQLRDWGITPVATVGHSSGEIAASYASGLISMEDATIIAYYRGLHISRPDARAPQAGGMLAVGLGENDARDIVKEYSGRLTIAAINSPSSTTISGDSDAIIELKDRLAGENTFARQLRVSQAYHSHHMVPHAARYMAALEAREPTGEIDFAPCRMISSVTARLLVAEKIGPEYWAENLVSPVRFSDALVGTVLDERENKNIDLIIEIGPHAALKGPSNDVLSALKVDIPYVATLRRDQDDLRSLLDCVGELFTLGYPCILGDVNQTSEDKNEYLDDLPSYSWNQSSHWAQTRLTTAYLQRSYHHYLLGSLQPDSTIETKRWRNHLRASEIPWLLDHRIQDKPVFPASAYVSLAVEAALRGSETSPEAICNVTIHDVKIQSALEIPDGEQAVEIVMELRRAFSQSSNEEVPQWQFILCSFDEAGDSRSHCNGYITISRGPQAPLSETSRNELLLMEQSTTRVISSQKFYEHLASSGLQYSGAFQLADGDIETGPGFAVARMLAADDQPGVSELRKSFLDPAFLDAALHPAFAALEAKHSRPLQETYVPTSIQRLEISGLMLGLSAVQTMMGAKVLASVESRSTRMMTSTNKIYSSDGSGLLIRFDDIELTGVGATSNAQDKIPVFQRLRWLPAFSLLGSPSSLGADLGSLSEILDLYGHQYPSSSIMHITPSLANTKSDILAALGSSENRRRRYQRLAISIEESPSSDRTYTDSRDENEDPIAVEQPQDGAYDLVVISSPIPEDPSLFLKDQGYLLASSDAKLRPSAILKPVFEHNGVRCWVKDDRAVKDRGVSLQDDMGIIHASRPGQKTLAIIALIEREIGRKTHCISLQDFAHANTALPKDIVVLANLDTDVLYDTSSRNVSEFEGVKGLLSMKGKRIVWVLEDSGYCPVNSKHALIHGMLRGIRTENPHSEIMTLDMSESHTSEEIVSSIRLVCGGNKPFEDEISMRNGSSYIPRVVVDEVLNRRLPQSHTETGEQWDAEKSTSLTFNSHKTYLLVGGFSGIGIPLARWMVSKGARNLAILSRSGARGPSAQGFLRWLEARKTRCHVFQGDVCDQFLVDRCIKQIGHSLGGVFHAAMVLKDSSIQSMTFDRWTAALMPKVKGLDNLDQATRHLNLDFFICLSSITCIVGPNAQANYIAGNSYMDSLIYRRWAEGLKSATLNIGFVSGIGFVARNKDVLDSSRRRGFYLLNEYELFCQIEEGIAAANSLAATTEEGLDTHQIISGAAGTFSDAFWHQKPLFRVLAAERGQQSLGHAQRSTSPSEPAGSLKELICAAPTTAARLDILIPAFVDQWSLVSGVPQDNIDSDMSLASYGLDSLSAMDVRNWLSKTIDVNVSTFDIFRGQSIKQFLSGIALSIPWEVSSNQEDEETPHRQERHLTVDSILLPNRPAHVPMSSNQSRFWLMHNLIQDKAHFNLPVVAYMQGTPDADILAKALATLKEYNEILRTRFVQGDRFPEQVLVNIRPYDIPSMDFSTQPDPQKALADFASQLRGRELNIGNGETFRFALAKLGPDRWALVMTAHHITCDRASLASLLSQFTGLYDAVKEGLDPRGSVDLPQIQYIDFTLWHNEKLRSSTMAEGIKFWQNKLAHRSPMSPLLPFSKGDRPEIQSFRTSSQQSTLDPTLFSRLKRICGESQATVPHFLLAAFQAFYCRYAGEHDLVILLVDGRRPHPDLTNTIGNFLNMIPICCEETTGQSFEELLRNMRDTMLECLEHSHVPFDHIVRELGIKPNTSCFPLSQVAFNYQVYGQTDRYQTADFTMESYDIEDVQTACEIQLEAIENADLGLTFTLQASKDLYRDSDIERFMENFQTFLESVIGDHRQSIDEIPLTGPEEIARLKQRHESSIFCESEWADFDLPLEIAQWATTTPDSIALVDSWGAKMSYAELVSKARRISATLQSMGAKPGDSIGLMSMPDSDMISGLLGIIFSQCAYVALEPNSVAERQLHMINDSQISILLIGNNVVVDDSLASPSISIVEIRDATEGTIGASLSKTPAELPLYITYTSGSTGKPKGVVMRHRNARPMFQAMHAEFGFRSDDRFLLATSLSWDLSVVEVFMPLLTGGTVCIASNEARQDPVLLGGFMKSTQATFTYFTPTQFSMLLQGAPDILRSCIEWRSALFCGEMLSSRLLVAFNALRTRATAYNLYGPCEAMVQVTVQNLSGFKPKAREVPIGRPLGQSRLYVMDPALNPIPDGLVGEICIGGPQVGEGYLNRPRESRTSFKMEPRLGGEISTGCRLFRTGDLGFFDDSGTLHMIGRKAGDTLVKLRGFRMDLRDVERNILEAGDQVNTSSIYDACVVVRKNETLQNESLGDERHLVAFIVPANPESVSSQSLVTDLHSRLKLLVASHMLPAGYHVLPALPLTTGGKTDRRHLIQQPVTLIRPRATKPPATHHAKISHDDILSDVMEHFSATLELPQNEVFDPNDSFFDLGGQSILLLTLQRRIQQHFGIEISLRDLVRDASPAGLCTLIQQSLPSRQSSSADAGSIQGIINPVNNHYHSNTSGFQSIAEKRVDDDESASHSRPLGGTTAPEVSRSTVSLGNTKLESVQKSDTVRIDWARETELPPNDQYHIPVGGPYPAVSRPNFMIIGVDSFLGIHLLVELLCNTNAVIYVMGCTEAISHRQLMHMCRKFDLFTLPGVSREVLWARVRCYPGTITSHRFGLRDEEFTELGSKIHVIYHLGVVVSALRSYWDLKPVNVRPILDVLELASSGPHVSAIHCVSTASVCHMQSWSTPQGPGANTATQELPPSLDRPPANDQNGYIVTRWVGEMLLANAAERGFPITIHRAATAVSSTRTQIPPDAGITDRLIQTMLHTGLIPNLNWGDRPMVVDFVPVDVLASWLRILVQNPGESCDSDSSLVIHHLTNPSPLPLDKLAEKIGGNLVDLEGWLSHIRSLVFDTGEDELAWASISHLLQGSHVMFALDRSKTEDVLQAAGQLNVCPTVQDDLFRAFPSSMPPFSKRQTPPSRASSSASSSALSGTHSHAVSIQDIDTASSVNSIDKDSLSPMSSTQFTADQQWFCNLQMASALLAVDALRKISHISFSTLTPHRQKLYHLIHRVAEQAPAGHIPGITPEEWHELVANPARQQELFKAVERADADGALLLRVSTQLPAIFSDDMDPLYLFFAQDDLMARFYAEDMERGDIQTQLSEYLCKLRMQTHSLDILEAGAGTGSLTEQVLEGLCPRGKSAESRAINQFVFTDISPRFFSKAKEHLSSWQNVLDFRKLDIGSDVLKQGFAPQSFDVIVAANVLHATPNLLQTLRNVRTLLKPSGKLLFLEVVRQDLLWVNMTMGTLAGWWLSEEDVRQECPCVSVTEWNWFLAQSGFSPVEIEFQSSSSSEFSKFSVMVANAV